VIDFNKDDITPTNTGQVIVALDIARFLPVEAFKRRVDEVIRDFRNSPRMPGVDHIRFPGEQSHAIWLERSAHGILLPDVLFKNLQQVASELAIEGLRETPRLWSRKSLSPSRFRKRRWLGSESLGGWSSIPMPLTSSPSRS